MVHLVDVKRYIGAALITVGRSVGVTAVGK